MQHCYIVPLLNTALLVMHVVWESFTQEPSTTCCQTYEQLHQTHIVACSPEYSEAKLMRSSFTRSDRQGNRTQRQDLWPVPRLHVPMQASAVPEQQSSDSQRCKAAQNCKDIINRKAMSHLDMSHFAVERI